MTERICIKVQMELLSDAIFGSGYSIPGGEDIAVCTDAAGWPYLKGSTLKGLLRESMEDYICWTGGSEQELTAILGKDDRNGTDDGRRIHLTDLLLSDHTGVPEDCFSSRMFTKMKDGVVADRTLRMARCIRRGLRFTGELSCQEEDMPLILDALRAIKWAGTMRSRGFGRVKTWGEQTLSTGKTFSAAPCNCLRYRIRTEAPVLITDPARSSGNNYETRSYLPGSAIRGLVINLLAKRQPAWFEEHRIELLTEDTRFLDAYPAGEEPTIPAIMGFYEDKEERRFESVLQTGDVSPELKRAKLGQFCALRGVTVITYSAKTERATRIDRSKEKTEMFQTRALSAGQEFEGYIQFKDPAFAEVVASCLPETIWLGADRYAGLGKCSVTALETAEAPSWQAYSFSDGDIPGETLYLMAVSPFSMRSSEGDPCGLDETELARRLGVDKINVLLCSTAVKEYGGYNRTWGSREIAVKMYERGSIFKLSCTPAPALDKLRHVMAEGLGIRRAEGFGQVLFLRSDLYEGLTHKEKNAEKQTNNVLPDAVLLRRAKYQWVMENADGVAKWKLSKSQIGTIQSICEQALAAGGDCTELEQFLEKNLSGRGVAHGERFKKAAPFIRNTLQMPLRETLGKEENALPGVFEDDISARLRLLIELFDFSRKEGVGK